ncbi:MAG: FadR/GntR family transcriptional regulator [Rudaea sp.]|nr:FadR/GntR family transcriptional regulator [Rudaea sp.]
MMPQCFDAPQHILFACAQWLCHHLPTSVPGRLYACVGHSPLRESYGYKSESFILVFSCNTKFNMLTALPADLRKARRSMGMDFATFDGAVTRIRVPKTSEIVSDQIRAQIVRGEIGEGDFLPPEGTLMESLGISRPTLREAFRILEAEGLISVVRGSRTGARVHKPSVELVSRYSGYVLESLGTTIADLYQARLAIEPSVVRWLATDHGRGQIEALQNVIAQLAQMLEQQRYDDYVESVEVFHHALVQAAGNKTLSFMNRILLNLASKHQRDYHRRHPPVRDARLKSLYAGLKSYKKLIALIEAGSVEQAVAHWRLHLHNANATWASREEGVRVVDSLGT